MLDPASVVRSTQAVLRKDPPQGINATYINDFFRRNESTLASAVESVLAPMLARDGGMVVSAPALARALSKVLRAAPEYGYGPSAFGLTVQDGHVQATNGFVAAVMPVATVGRDWTVTRYASHMVTHQFAQVLVQALKRKKQELVVCKWEAGRLLLDGTVLPIEDRQTPYPPLLESWPSHTWGNTLDIRVNRAELFQTANSLFRIASAEPATSSKWTVGLFIRWDQPGSIRLIARRFGTSGTTPVDIPVSGQWPRPGVVELDVEYLSDALLSFDADTVRIRISPIGQETRKKRNRRYQVQDEYDPVEITADGDEPRWLIMPRRGL